MNKAPTRPAQQPRRESALVQPPDHLVPRKTSGIHLGKHLGIDPLEAPVGGPVMDGMDGKVRPDLPLRRLAMPRAVPPPLRKLPRGGDDAWGIGGTFPGDPQEKTQAAEAQDETPGVTAADPHEISIARRLLRMGK